MTTEILRNKLYRQCSTINNVEWVIFDEVHYINNEERGSVWEETIILLPRDVKLVMLSATVRNIEDFVDWVIRTNKKPMKIIKTLKRPVPLNHHIYFREAIKIKSEGEAIDEKSYKQLLLKEKESVKKNNKKKQEIVDKLLTKKIDLQKKSNQAGRVRKITGKSKKFELVQLGLKTQNYKPPEHRYVFL